MLKLEGVHSDKIPCTATIDYLVFEKTFNIHIVGVELHCITSFNAKKKLKV